MCDLRHYDPAGTDHQETADAIYCYKRRWIYFYHCNGRAAKPAKAIARLHQPDAIK